MCPTTYLKVDGPHSKDPALVGQQPHGGQAGGTHQLGGQSGHSIYIYNTTPHQVRVFSARRTNTFHIEVYTTEYFFFFFSKSMLVFKDIKIYYIEKDIYENV